MHFSQEGKVHNYHKPQVQIHDFLFLIGLDELKRIQTFLKNKNCFYLGL